MRKSKALFCAMLFCALPGHAQVQPGLWELRMRSSFGDAQSNAVPQVSRLCITPEQSGDPRTWTPRFGNMQCSVRDYSAQGNEASWNYACKGEPAMSGKGTLRWSPQRYEGSNRMELRRGEERMEMLQSYEARRIGDCVPEDKKS